MDKGRPLTLTAIFDRSLKGLITLDRVSTVAFLDVKVREPDYQLRNIAAGRSDLDRGGDRVAIVLDDKDYRQFQVAGGVQCLPPFALACRAVTNGHIHDLVAFKADNFILQLFNE